MKSRFRFKKVSTGKFDIVLFSIVTSLTLFGLLMIFNSSSVVAFNLFGDKYGFIKDQIVWCILGFAALFIAYRTDYHKLYHLALPLLIIALVLLILVFIPGIGSNALGANRWVNLGFITLQPAEFVKLGLAIYLAAWFSHKEKGRFGAFLLLMGAILLLIMLEPDLGTASIILFEALVIYFLSGGNIFYFLFIAPFVGIIGFLYIIIEPYRLSRLTSFLNLGNSIQDTSYHVKQILIALGSGGLFGLGVGNSIQKYAYLPENVTDSIFPIIAEEFGFIGSVVLIMVFAAFIWRCLYIASRAKDSFGKLLAGGIIAFIGIQTVINLAAMTALVPLTGVPLPFISYGGSALIIDLASMGVLLNIAKQSRS
ncbi:MAG: putative lipid II flippase FtsW [Candidatus Levybacteria bacterium]|nr:putative lipid II flippase FtsW [Candidatus Levybacteria bacterium]